MQLTEDIRILAGLQETKKVINPINKLLETESYYQNKESQKSYINSNNINTQLHLFDNKLSDLQKYLQITTSLTFDNLHPSHIIMHEKFKPIHTYIDTVVNEDIQTTFNFIIENYEILSQNIKDYNLINEQQQELNHDSYFISTTLTIIDDMPILLYDSIIKDNIVGNMIEYGEQIFEQNDNLYYLKRKGKKIFTNITKKEIEKLQEKKYLL